MINDQSCESVDKGHNPLTKRDIQVGGKIYKQLLLLCNARYDPESLQALKKLLASSSKQTQISQKFRQVATTLIKESEKGTTQSSQISQDLKILVDKLQKSIKELNVSKACSKCDNIPNLKENIDKILKVQTTYDKKLEEIQAQFQNFQSLPFQSNKLELEKLFTVITNVSNTHTELLEKIYNDIQMSKARLPVSPPRKKPDKIAGVSPPRTKPDKIAGAVVMTRSSVQKMTNIVTAIKNQYTDKSWAALHATLGPLQDQWPSRTDECKSVITCIFKILEVSTTDFKFDFKECQNTDEWKECKNTDAGNKFLEKFETFIKAGQNLQAKESKWSHIFQLPMKTIGMLLIAGLFLDILTQDSQSLGRDMITIATTDLTARLKSLHNTGELTLNKFFTESLPDVSSQRIQLTTEYDLDMSNFGIVKHDDKIPASKIYINENIISHFQSTFRQIDLIYTVNEKIRAYELQLAQITGYESLPNLPTVAQKLIVKPSANHRLENEILRNIDFLSPLSTVNTFVMNTDVETTWTQLVNLYDRSLEWINGLLLDNVINKEDILSISNEIKEDIGMTQYDFEDLPPPLIGEDNTSPITPPTSIIEDVAIDNEIMNVVKYASDDIKCAYNIQACVQDWKNSLVTNTNSKEDALVKLRDALRIIIYTRRHASHFQEHTQGTWYTITIHEKDENQYNPDEADKLIQDLKALDQYKYKNVDAHITNLMNPGLKQYYWGFRIRAKNALNLVGQIKTFQSMETLGQSMSKKSEKKGLWGLWRAEEKLNRLRKIKNVI